MRAALNSKREKRTEYLIIPHLLMIELDLYI